MQKEAAIVVLGTCDTKGEEHFFLKQSIEKQGVPTLTIHVGTKAPATFSPDIDLFDQVITKASSPFDGRDEMIQAMIQRAQELIMDLDQKGVIAGIISAGGGSGTHLCTSVMRVLPLGIPKDMVSTVAAHDMAEVVGTKDITMMHSVVDLLGVNSISGMILDQAAGAVCGMVRSRWKPPAKKSRIALAFFGFITKAAEEVKRTLEAMDYEVIPFHANGTGGMAMEELAEEGYFSGILDLATHELADALMDGYCGGIGPGRFEPVTGKEIPRLVIPGGLDCAVLEFTRRQIPEAYRDRKIFFYDFRSAIRLTREESRVLAEQLSEKLNRDAAHIRILVPTRGWSAADKEGAPLYEPSTNAYLIQVLKDRLDRRIKIEETDLHINDKAFAKLAAKEMDQMVKDHLSL